MPDQQYSIDVVVDPSRSASGTQGVIGQLDQMGSAAGKVQAVISRLLTLFAGLAAAFSLNRAIREALRFNQAMAEVSTLVNTATFDIERLNRASLANARAFGGNAVDQAKAFYQAISSGASDAAAATELVTAANRLAVGGMTDVFIATDGLTSILNAYGLEAEDATGISDALFTAMRAGKTTIGELASSLGRVTPIAASTGVTFDELAAAVSALTLAGISTREATTGVRAILAAIAKPTAEAAKLSKQLGIEFNAAGLEALGFQNFLNQVLDATQGNTDQLALLFGGVEALIPIMSLAGAGGEEFARILDSMADKTGETDLAFQKVEDTISFQVNRLWPALVTQMTAVGTALISAPGLIGLVRTLADNMDVAVGVAGTLGAALAVAFTPNLIRVIRRIRDAVITLNVAMSTNPYIAVAVALTTLIGLTIAFRRQIGALTIGSVQLADIFVYAMGRINESAKITFEFLGDFWEGTFDNMSDRTALFLSDVRTILIGVYNVAKFTANRWIGLWDGVIRLTGLLFKSVPRALDNIWAQVVNSTSATIEQIVRGFGVMVGGINQALNAIVDGASATVNAVRGVFAGAVAFIATTWDALPGILSNVGKRAVNALIDSIGTGISAIGREIRNLFRQITGRDAIEGELTNRLERFRFDVVDQSSDTGFEASKAFNDAFMAAQGEGFRGTLPTEFFTDIALPRREIEGAAQEAVVGWRQILQDALTRDYYGDILDNLFTGGAGVAAARRNERQRQAITARFDPRDNEPEIPEGVIPALNAGLDEGLSKSQELRDAVAQLQAVIDGNQGAQLDVLRGSIESGEGGFLAGFLTSLDDGLVKTRDFAGDIGSIFGDLANQITTGFGDAVGHALVFAEDRTESLKDAMDDLGKRVLADLISSFVQLGVQFVTTKILGDTLQQASLASATANAAGIAAAYSSAAALASLATSGGNAIAAKTGISTTLALTKSLAAFRDGTDFVRGAGSSISDSILARLSVGEGIVSAAANRNNPGAVAAMNRGERIGRDGPVNLNVRVVNNSTAQIETRRLSETDVEIIARDVASEAVREEAPLAIASEIESGYGRVPEALERRGNYTPRRT